MALSIQEQVEELDLIMLGMVNRLSRIRDGSIKRAPEDESRLQSRLDRVRAAHRTLELVAEHADAFRGLIQKERGASA